MNDLSKRLDYLDALDDLSAYPHELQHVEHLGEYNPDAERVVADVDTANVYTSLISDGPHKGEHTIALDIDVPARLVPSSTPGHSHLYIDVPMKWDTLQEVLMALASAGVIEDGYVSASLVRGHTALRLPWVAK